AEQVVVAVIALDQLVADGRDELTEVEAQSLADGHNVRGVGLLQIDIAGYTGGGIAKQAARGGRARGSGEGEIDAKAEVARIGNGLLQHQLGGVDSNRIVVVIECAELILFR